MERNDSTASEDDSSRFKAIMQEAGFCDGLAPPFEVNNIKGGCVGCPALRRKMGRLAWHADEIVATERACLEGARGEEDVIRATCWVIAKSVDSLCKEVEETQAMVDACDGVVETSGVNNSTGEEVHVIVCGSPKSGTQSEDEPATVIRGKVKTMEEELSGWRAKPGGSVGNNQDQ